MAATTSSPPTRMLFPVVVSLNENATIGSGRIAVHPAMPFDDLLSAIAQNLAKVFLFSRSASVTSIDMVERDTSSVSSCSYITPVNQAFDFSSLANKGDVCHFLIKVYSDLCWDMERGDPIIEFEEWKYWREENQNRVECEKQTLPMAGPHERSIES